MLVVVSANKVGNFESKNMNIPQPPKKYRQLKKPSKLVKDTSTSIL